MKEELKKQLQTAITESLLAKNELPSQKLNWTDQRYYLSHIFERNLSENDLSELGLGIFDLVDIVEDRPGYDVDWMAAGQWDSNRQKLTDQGIIFDLPQTRQNA